MEKNTKKRILEEITLAGFTKGDYREILTRQLEELNSEIEVLEGNKIISQEMEGKSVRVSISNGCRQYYVHELGNKKIRYAKTKEIDLVRRIIQKEYDVKVLKKLLYLRNKLQRFLKEYDIDEIKGIYDRFCKEKQNIINPIVMTEEEYITAWKESNPGNQNSFPEERVYQTNAGEMVRSKSEKILADLFLRYQIPYQYEPKLLFADGQSVCPDFVLLNVRKRKTIYWEHLGLVSNPDYATKSLNKLMLYEKNGYRIGNNLILSMESEKISLGIKVIEEKIKTNLL